MTFPTKIKPEILEDQECEHVWVEEDCDICSECGEHTEFCRECGSECCGAPPVSLDYDFDMER